MSMETQGTLSPRLILLENLEIPEKEEVLKQPENSFLENTCQDSHNLLSEKVKLNLFSKLELMAKERE